MKTKRWSYILNIDAVYFFFLNSLAVSVVINDKILAFFVSYFAWENKCSKSGFFHVYKFLNKILISCVAVMTSSQN